MKNDIMFALITSCVLCVMAMVYSLEIGTLSCGILVAGICSLTTLVNIKDIYYSDIWEEA